jgi:hypothetical protein
VDVQLDPAQPDEVVRAVSELLRQERDAKPDPWWQSGIDDTLETDS